MSKISQKDPLDLNEKLLADAWCKYHAKFVYENILTTKANYIYGYGTEEERKILEEYFKDNKHMGQFDFLY